MATEKHNKVPFRRDNKLKNWQPFVEGKKSAPLKRPYMTLKVVSQEELIRTRCSAYEYLI